MEHGKNMDYAEEIKALKKALAERDAIIAKQKRDYDALEAKFPQASGETGGEGQGTGGDPGEEKGRACEDIRSQDRDNEGRA